MRNLLEEQIEATQKGARWLDSVAPDWYKVLDLGNVNIFDARSCICTKLVEFGVLADVDNKYNCCHSYGFVPYRGENEAYEPANQRAIECWQREIDQRKFYEEDNKNNAISGAKYLDGIIPDWYRYIKVEELDFIDPTHCMCGQLRSAGKMSKETFSENYVSKKKGFLPSYNSQFVVESLGNKMLKNAWKAEIEQRLEADKKKNELPATIKIRLTRQHFRLARAATLIGNSISETCIVAQACKAVIPGFTGCGFSKVESNNKEQYEGGTVMRKLTNYFDLNYHKTPADKMYKYAKELGWLNIELRLV